mgnify:CR=1 FL=1
MAQLIKNGAVTVDSWKTLEIGDADNVETITLPAGEVIFPLAVWQARAGFVKKAKVGGQNVNWSGGKFKQRVERSPYHREPFNGSSAWNDNLRSLFDIPNASQIDVGELLSRRR